MSLNILLIAPAEGDWQRIGKKRAFNGKTFRFSMLSLLSVAALSPKDARIRIVDEQVEDVPDGDFDLVGITAMTAVAPRAYTWCARFRERGVPVVMGGFHATLNQEEALLHADAVVVGPAYGAWQRVCEDVAAGRLERIYHGDPEGAIPVHLPRHLLDKGKYVTVSSTFATLGCRNQCRFCSIHPFHQGRRCARPVADVVAEVATFQDRFFVFVDDNLTQDPDYALELFRALKPLGKQWVLQASIEITDNQPLLEAMRDAGCLGVFIGLETFNEEALRDSDKAFNRPQRYQDAVRAFHRHGMYVEAGVIVGFDADDTTVFRSTLTMLDWIGIDAIQMSILTPLPGAGLCDSMRGRITDRDWRHYDYRHVVFAPARMTAAELQAGADWLIRSYYAPWRIARRVWRWMAVPNGWRHFIYPLGLNLAYFGRTWRFHIHGYDPAAGATPAPAPQRAS